MLLIAGPLIGLAEPAKAHEVDPCQLHAVGIEDGPDRGEIRLNFELDEDTDITDLEIVRDDGQTTTIPVTALFEQDVEVGTVDLGNTIDEGTEATVSYSTSFDDPVVVAYISSRNGDEAIDVRVRDVDSTGFTVFMEEPDGEAHKTETVQYIVAESGVNKIVGTDMTIQAGNAVTNAVHRTGQTYDNAENRTNVTYFRTFSQPPAVLSTVETYNNGDFMSSTVFDVTVAQFKLSLEAAGSGSPAAGESVGWIALSRGSGHTASGHNLTAAVEAADGDDDGVDDSPEDLDYTVDGPAGLLVQGNTVNERDGFWVRGASAPTSTGAAVFAEEDQVDDAEQSHASEGFSFLALSPATGALATAEGPLPYTGNWVDSGLGDNVTHQYEVTPICSGSAGPTVGPLEATTFGPPSEPRDLVVANVPQGGNESMVCGPSFDEHAEIKLTWEVPEERDMGIDAYRVYRGPDEGNLSLIQEFDAGKERARFGNTQDQSYFYDCEIGDGNTSVWAVQAVNDIDGGPLTVSAPTLVVGPPTAPNATSAEADSTGTSVDVSWEAPADDGGAPIYRYTVLRGTDADDLSPIDTVDADRTSYRDTDVSPLQTYHYAVQAWNGIDTSPSGPTDCASTGLGGLLGASC